MPAPGPRPQLAAGLRVVRRGLHHLQVGLYDGRRALLPRTEEVERALDLLLERGGDDADHVLGEVLGHLDARGCLRWERPPRGTVAVLGRFDTRGLPDLSELLGSAGVPLTPSVEAADVVIVLSPGELDRATLDPLVRVRTSHLVVRLVDGGALLGPFVVPGVTACLRCIDAHQSLHDPDHAVVTARYAHATARARPDGVPDLDHALAAVALAWAARDALAHLSGREPSTWSRTLHLGADPSQHHEQAWLRHPECGCCWP